MNISELLTKAEFLLIFNILEIELAINGYFVLMLRYNVKLERIQDPVLYLDCQLFG